MVSPNRLVETATSKRVRLDTLLPDTHNRKLRDARVDKIAREFDFAKWSPPVVRQNGNDTPTIIDGHHRIAAACKAGLGEMEVITYCHPPVETDMWVGSMYIIGLNNTLASTPTEKFLMRLRAADPVAIGVAAIIEAGGFEGITDLPTDGFVHTPTACEWAYKGGPYKRRGNTPEALAFALETSKKTYGKTKQAVRRDFIRGFASFALRYPKLDPAEVARKVRERHPEPGDLLASTNTMADALGSQSHKAMALVIRQDFNHQRKARRLKEW